ncbi:MAG: HAD family hydrolase [Flavobacteriales bacterium]|nr:HAD family hydrolase [Flavobacteriales bacterium]
MAKLNKAIFLDRDGVINHDPGDYTKSLAEFQILPGVFSTMKKLNDLGYHLILITNQGGIAKGLYSHEDVAEIHSFLQSEATKFGVVITDIFYSPHHDDFGLSLTRKPGSLMVERGLARYDIAPELSLMVGDKQRDLDAAAPCAVPGVLIETNSALEQIMNKLA